MKLTRENRLRSAVVGVDFRTRPQLNDIPIRNSNVLLSPEVMGSFETAMWLGPYTGSKAHCAHVCRTTGELNRYHYPAFEQGDEYRIAKVHRSECMSFSRGLAFPCGSSLEYGIHKITAELSEARLKT
jgi:hypothetical protein